MKFWNWILTNLSHIINFVSIGLTLYFGIFYVPDWLKDARREKIENAGRDLELSIKELIYADSICKYSEIESLVKAKEFLINETFPITEFEVLTKVQASFMEDRFLPLEKRKMLIAELETLKKQIPPVKVNVENISKAESQNTLVSILSATFSILVVIVGIASYYLRFKREKDKDEEIGNQISEAEESKSSIESAYEFERSIIQEIANYPGVKIVKSIRDGNADSGFDLEFTFNDRPYFVAIKYLTKSKVGLNSIQRFLYNIKGLEGEFWFIYNTDITQMVNQKVTEMSKLFASRRKVKLIHAESIKSFGTELKVLLQSN